MVAICLKALALGLWPRPRRSRPWPWPWGMRPWDFGLDYITENLYNNTCRKRKYEHITATLCDDLHWLPIRQWITYKLCSVYHCLQVSTRGSSILSDRNVCSGCCQHWPSLSAFSSTWRSDRAQNENDNVWLALQSPNHVSGMISHRLCIVHRTRTVPKQTKDNTISLSLRDMTWHFHDCLGW